MYQGYSVVYLTDFMIYTLLYVGVFTNNNFNFVNYNKLFV